MAAHTGILVTAQDAEEYEAGSSLCDLAEKHGCSLQNIRYHLRRLGCELRRSGWERGDWQASRRKEVKKLAAKGMDAKKIADALKISTKTVYKWRRRTR